MARPKGLPKTGGRKAGVPNKRSSEFETKLKALNIDPIAGIVSELQQLTSDRRVSTLLSLLPYLYPKKLASFVPELTEEEISRIPDTELIEQAKRLIGEMES